MKYIGNWIIDPREVKAVRRGWLFPKRRSIVILKWDRKWLPSYKRIRLKMSIKDVRHALGL